MCGIAGILGRFDPQGRDLERMLEAIRHRGPDGEGVHTDAHVTLGHRRLSIIDLAGGRQPLRNVDGTIWLVCNGEIYNYVELRKELEAPDSGSSRTATAKSSSACIKITATGFSSTCVACMHSRSGMRATSGSWPRAITSDRSRFSTRCRPDGSHSPRRSRRLLALDPALRKINLAAIDQYLALRLIAPPLSACSRACTNCPPGTASWSSRTAAPMVLPLSGTCTIAEAHRLGGRAHRRTRGADRRGVAPVHGERRAGREHS